MASYPKRWCVAGSLRSNHVCLAHLHGNLQVCEGGSSSRNDSEFLGGSDGIQSVLVTELLVAELSFSRSSHFNPGNPTTKGGNSLLSLVLVKVGVGGLRFLPNLRDARLRRSKRGAFVMEQGGGE